MMSSRVRIRVECDDFFIVLGFAGFPPPLFSFRIFFPWSALGGCGTSGMAMGKAKTLDRAQRGKVTIRVSTT